MEYSQGQKKILEAALDLFARNGYEATSVGQIAQALGIKTPSLYSHFSGKQEIFECLLKEITVHYEEHTPFAAHQESSFSAYKTAEGATAAVQAHVHFLLHDPTVSRFRKLFSMEQYRNPAIAAMQEQRSYGDIFRYHTELMAYLLREGILQGEDAEVMALQFISPVSVQLFRVDRDPSLEEEALEQIRRHILHFYEICGIPAEGA